MDISRVTSPGTTSSDYYNTNCDILPYTPPAIGDNTNKLPQILPQLQAQSPQRHSRNTFPVLPQLASQVSMLSSLQSPGSLQRSASCSSYMLPHQRQQQRQQQQQQRRQQYGGTIIRRQTVPYRSTYQPTPSQATQQSYSRFRNVRSGAAPVTDPKAYYCYNSSAASSSPTTTTTSSPTSTVTTTPSTSPPVYGMSMQPRSSAAMAGNGQYPYCAAAVPTTTMSGTAATTATSGPSSTSGVLYPTQQYATPQHQASQYQTQAQQYQSTYGSQYGHQRPGQQGYTGPQATTTTTTPTSIPPRQSIVSITTSSPPTYMSSSAHSMAGMSTAGQRHGARPTVSSIHTRTTGATTTLSAISAAPSSATIAPSSATVASTPQTPAPHTQARRQTCALPTQTRPGISIQSQTVPTQTQQTQAQGAQAPTAAPARPPIQYSPAMISQALEIARESSSGEHDPFIRQILDSAMTLIWSRVEAEPESYVMTRSEFALFNFCQNRYLGDKLARGVRVRFWDSAST